MALGEFVLPSVLPHDVDALKTLILAQQNAHAAVVQSMHQAMHQEAAASAMAAKPLRATPFTVLQQSHSNQ
jgi:prolyl-tRNA editing enzyme YbaK/EbsC (Cys-tRNA(Pro) deacylase)